MKLSARPLLDNAADQALFVGRDDALQRIDRSLRSGLNCVVVGDPGSGKTSLVRAVMYRADASSSPLRLHYVRAGAARSAADLLEAVLVAVRRSSLPAAESRSAIDLLDELTKALAAAGQADPGTHVVVVEDVSAGVGTEVFGALRDELWRVGALWLVTVSSTQAPGLLRPPADVFFENRVDLGPLAAAEAREILARRTEPDDVAIPADVVAAAASAADTPRRLLEVARELSADRAVGGLRLTTVAGLTNRTQTLTQMSRPAQMLARELEALGWCSASDERLLDRIGWTRPRVVQVMGELASRGLVQMREERTGRGRPRKLYRLTPASEFSAGGPGDDAPPDRLTGESS